MQHHPRSGLSRRQLLRGAGALAGGAAAGALAGCSTPLAAGLAQTALHPSTVSFWNLWAGGDGARAQTIFERYRRAQGRTDSLQAVTFAWGNPYYTKLSLATLGGRPPNVAVCHLTRVPNYVRSGLLTELTGPTLAGAGLSGAAFSPAIWRTGLVHGRAYALPVDVTPIVLYYNRAICKRAGLLDARGELKPIVGRQAFQAALAAGQRAGARWGAVAPVINDPASNWRWFQTLYSQQGGPPFLGQDGRSLTYDEGLVVSTLRYMRTLTGSSGLMPGQVDYATTISAFISGQAAFMVMGEWEVTTVITGKVPFGMVTIPQLFHEKSVWADTHALVFPRQDYAPGQLRRTLGFAKFFLDQTYTWAEGGHIPAYLPVRDSRRYAELKPQSNYADTSGFTAFDAPAWYSGSGSNFEIVLGSEIALVQQGLTSPRAAVASIRRQLATYAATPNPL